MKDNKTVKLFINTATKVIELGAKVGDSQSLVRLGNPKRALERTNIGIKVLADELGFELKDVDEFYCLLGPGSNTGIRLGLTIPRTIFGVNTNIKVFGIKTMDLLTCLIDSCQAVLSDRSGNLFTGVKKDKTVSLKRIDKKDVGNIDDTLPLFAEAYDSMALTELEGKKIQKIDTVVLMMNFENLFTDFSNDIKNFLPEYALKI